MHCNMYSTASLAYPISNPASQPVCPRLPQPVWRTGASPRCSILLFAVRPPPSLSSRRLTSRRRLWPTSTTLRICGVPGRHKRQPQLSPSPCASQPGPVSRSLGRGIPWLGDKPELTRRQSANAPNKLSVRAEPRKPKHTQHPEMQACLSFIVTSRTRTMPSSEYVVDGPWIMSPSVTRPPFLPLRAPLCSEQDKPNASAARDSP